MAEVVICCADEDRAIARRLADAVTRAGYSVWWNEAPAADFWNSDEVIAQIGEAEAVVALWSRASAASALFRTEAEAARGQHKLILTSADGRAPPAPFDGAEIILIDNWHGGHGHSGLRRILAAIEKSCGARIPAGDLPAPKRHGAVVLAAALAGAALLAAATLPWGGRPDRAPAEPEIAASPMAPPAMPAMAVPRAAPAVAKPTVAPEPPKSEVQLALKTELPAREAESRQGNRPSAATAAKATAKVAKAKAPRKAAGPRIKYRYAENMRLFCEAAGKGTQQCRTFRRNVRRGAILPKEPPRPRLAFPA